MAYISVFIENIFTLFFQKQFPSLNAQYIYKLLSQGILCYIQNNLTAPNLWTFFCTAPISHLRIWYCLVTR
jgi:hypothetical protein